MVEVNSTLNSRERGVLPALMADHEAGTTAKDMSARLADIPEVVRTMVRHPDLFARQVDIGIYLLRQGALSGAERELAILRTGWLCQAPYEWGEHVMVAKGSALPARTSSASQSGRRRLAGVSTSKRYCGRPKSCIKTQ